MRQPRSLLFSLPLVVALLSLFSLASCGVFAPPLRPPSEGGRAWRELATAHFTLATDLPEGEARAMLAHLELCVHALEEVAFPNEHGVPLRLRVVAFDSIYDYRAVAPWGTSGRYFDARPGYLETTPTIVTFGALTPETQATAVHELVHAFVRRAYRRAPTWLDEGLAEYFSSLHIENGEVTFGSPPPGMIILSSIVPHARDVLAADREPFDGRIGSRDGDPSEDIRRGGYYLGAWALVHMMRNGPDEYRERFDRYIATANDGAPLDEAWASFERGLDDERFERDFRTYLDRGDWPLMRTTLSTAAPSARPGAARTMTDDEVKVLWATLVSWKGDGVAQATRWLDDAVREAPSSARSHYWRGLLALHGEQYSDAIHEEREALRVSPGAPEATLALAISLIRADRVRARGRRSVSTELAELTDSLATTARTGRQHAFVADMRLAQRRLDDALAASERATTVDPLSSLCLATRAEVLFAAGRFADAVDAEERAIRYLPDGASHDRFVKDLRRYRAAAARAQ